MIWHISLWFVVIVASIKTIQSRWFHLESDFVNLCSIVGEDVDRMLQRRWKLVKKWMPTIILWPFTSYAWWFIIGYLLLLLILYKCHYWQLKQRYQNHVQQVRFQFPIWLRQLQILMQYNTVYQALKQSIPTAPLLFQPALMQLVTVLADNPLNYEAYLSFMAQFNIYEITKVMRLLYRFQTVGQQEATRQLNRILQTTSQMLKDQRKRKHEYWIQSKQWYGLVPLLGVTIVFLFLMANVLMNFFTKGVML